MQAWQNHSQIRGRRGAAATRGNEGKADTAQTHALKKAVSKAERTCLAAKNLQKYFHRLYSPIGLTVRACTKDYKIPGTDVVLKRNDTVSFSPVGIHTDPRYYSHPDEFYPEHFSPEEKASRSP